MTQLHNVMLLDLLGLWWKILEVFDWGISVVLFLSMPRSWRRRWSSPGEVHRNQTAIRALVDLLSALEERRILDLGCGIGALSSEFSHQTKTEIISLDLNFDLLKRAARDGVKSLVCANGMYLPFNDNSFDAIVMVHSLEHIPEDFRDVLAQEIKRVARLGAVIHGPAGEDALSLSHQFIQTMISRGVKVPAYAYEHLEMGMPQLEWFREAFPGCMLQPRRNLSVELRTITLEFTPVLRWLSGFYYHHSLSSQDDLPPYVEWTMIWRKGA
jgi:ubiquinone/menaquinone biosynthesis C-methylase UbiE